MTTFFPLYKIGGAIEKKSRRASDPSNFVIDRKVFEPLKSSVWAMTDDRKWPEIAGFSEKSRFNGF